jgi:hypothetical protein
MATERWTDEMLDKLAESVNSTKQTVESLAESIRDQSAESKELGIRFSAYQQASQWVVNLAFGLLATATITTIITAVFRK